MNNIQDINNNYNCAINLKPNDNFADIKINNIYDNTEFDVGSID